MLLFLHPWFWLWWKHRHWYVSHMKWVMSLYKHAGRSSNFELIAYVILWCQPCVCLLLYPTLQEFPLVFISTYQHTLVAHFSLTISFSKAKTNIDQWKCLHVLWQFWNGGQLYFTPVPCSGLPLCKRLRLISWPTLYNEMWRFPTLFCIFRGTFER